MSESAKKKKPAETVIKVKITDMISEIVGAGLLEETLRELSPRYEGREINAETFGLSQNQFERLYKKLASKLNERLLSQITTTLEHGEGVEIPHVSLTFVHVSEKRQNKFSGQLSRKLSIRTREPMKRLLNGTQV